MSEPQTFTRFADLPCELRLIIWKFALSRRTSTVRWGVKRTPQGEYRVTAAITRKGDCTSTRLTNSLANQAIKEDAKNHCAVISHDAVKLALPLILTNKATMDDPRAGEARSLADKKTRFGINVETDVLELLGPDPQFQFSVHFNSFIEVAELCVCSLALSVRHVSIGESERFFNVDKWKGLVDAISSPDCLLETVTISVGDIYQFRVCRVPELVNVFPISAEDHGTVLKDEESLLFSWCRFLSQQDHEDGQDAEFCYRDGDGAHHHRLAIFLVLRPSQAAYFEPSTLPNTLDKVPGRWATRNMWGSNRRKVNKKPLKPFSTKWADDIYRWSKMTALFRRKSAHDGSHHHLHALHYIPFHGVCRPEFRLPVGKADQTKWSDDAWETRCKPLEGYDGRMNSLETSWVGFSRFRITTDFPPKRTAEPA